MKWLRECTEKDLSGKRVLLRVDYNTELVSQPDGHKTMLDDYRVQASFESIDYLLRHHACIVLLAHLGEPKGIDPALSLEPIFQYLVKYYSDAVFVHTLEELAAKSAEGASLILFENIRFLPEEYSNDIGLAKKLAEFGDIYVNDAFAVSHKNNASLVALAGLLPSFAGFQLEKEITKLNTILLTPKHPLVCIVGGIKIDTKLPLLTHLARFADTILLGSGLVAPLLTQNQEEIKVLLNTGKLILPEDVVVRHGDDVSTFLLHDINVTHGETHTILDIGPIAIERYAACLRDTAMIMWNGPLGFFEDPRFEAGSVAIARKISESPATSIVGGGETVALIRKLNLVSKFDFVSTGGGAMIAYLSGKELPGIKALQ
ncbi:MAG: phosphoglycerate kinase [Patescibacteria group bacterium]|nr:phosphoglycerate kinase [Patescibacteria group bacterium]MDE2437836.1 phosphoglycerate kinase [Patescibacteria group bacterium]